MPFLTVRAWQPGFTIGLVSKYVLTTFPCMYQDQIMGYQRSPPSPHLVIQNFAPSPPVCRIEVKWVVLSALESSYYQRFE